MLVGMEADPERSRCRPGPQPSPIVYARGTRFSTARSRWCLHCGDVHSCRAMFRKRPVLEIRWDVHGEVPYG